MGDQPGRDRNSLQRPGVCQQLKGGRRHHGNAVRPVGGEHLYRQLQPELHGSGRDGGGCPGYLRTVRDRQTEPVYQDWICLCRMEHSSGRKRNALYRGTDRTGPDHGAERHRDPVRPVEPDPLLDPLQQEQRGSLWQRGEHQSILRGDRHHQPLRLYPGRLYL